MIIVVAVLILSIIIYISSTYRDRINVLQIKIDTIEEKINSILLKRKELLKDSENLIKELVNTKKDIYEGFESLNSDMSMIELDRKLLVYINEFNLIKDKYSKLEEDENFSKLSFSIDEMEDLLTSYKKYYNDNIEKYNKSIKKFPISIISLIKRRKQKSFFDYNEK